MGVVAGPSAMGPPEHEHDDAASGDGIQKVVDAHGLTWRAASEDLDVLTQHVAPCLPRRHGPPDGVVLRPLKRSKRRQVYAWDSPGRASLVIKRYPARQRFPELLRDAVRTRARDEFDLGRRLRSLQFDTPRPLGVAERWHQGRIRESYYVAEELRGAVALGPYLEGRHQPGDRDAGKLALVRRALALARRLHDAGLQHRDYHGGNLILREAEGPAAVLYLIDFPVALDLGWVPDELRARDHADLLYSLRHALSVEECADALDALAVHGPPRGLLQSALEEKQRQARRDRARRATQTSSQYATERSDRQHVHRERSLSADDLQRILAHHREDVEQGSSRVVRLGRKSRLTMQEVASPDGPSHAVVKEFTAAGGGARRRARAAWAGGIALHVADVPTPQPLALVLAGAKEPAYVVSRGWPDATPLHLLAHRPGRRLRDGQRAQAQRLTEAVRALLVQLVRADLVHPDLSLKNVLARTPDGAPVELGLVDWDGVRPRRLWSESRLCRALAQLGDVPAHVLSKTARLRFLRALLRDLDLTPRLAKIARASDRKLQQRRKLDQPIGGRP